MKAFDVSFFYSKNPKTVEVPDDLLTIHLLNFPEGTYTLCHSDSKNTWYLLSELQNRTDGIYSAVVSSGTWLDCCSGFSSLSAIHAPFKWGCPIKSKSCKYIEYLPFWEIVGTGKYNDEGLEIRQEEYRILTSYLYEFIEDQNTTQANMMSQFEVNSFGTDIISLVEYLQIVTGTTF